MKNNKNLELSGDYIAGFTESPSLINIPCPARKKWTLNYGQKPLIFFI
ncbi:MAG: hypothetical protein AAB959_01255 [Patescibacteria group bacterium]